jgi:hypothetical protein
VWWHTSVIPALRRLRQEIMNSKPAWATIVGLCLKKKKKKRILQNSTAPPIFNHEVLKIFSLICKRRRLLSPTSIL